MITSSGQSAANYVDIRREGARRNGRLAVALGTRQDAAKNIPVGEIGAAGCWSRSVHGTERVCFVPASHAAETSQRDLIADEKPGSNVAHQPESPVRVDRSRFGQCNSSGQGMA